MSRPSTLHSARGSLYAPAPPQPLGSSGGAPPPTGAAARLAAKQAELEGLRQLREQSARLARDVEALGDGIDQLVGGGDAVAAVLSSWQGVFRAIQLARASSTVAPLPEGVPPPANELEEQEAESRRTVPETLVRIPVEGAQARPEEQ
ncbi:hypothetical protein FA09DRAFT_328637 [Tilletiopsis washingtonensis]|uniref:DASH complex subunit DAD2 n=1 Tax=Tilletiopsis washingtonensis TaxID=58919 RepID=A0A316ZG16_9BASI|nr:hypothetical protein FA09DRAFT_328637 [Tilletiopsis washingtonensis]PWN99862.1 hypothetical protein FA09DRAFT_328637 [Tilletiopsis washingtonensis]